MIDPAEGLVARQNRPRAVRDAYGDGLGLGIEEFTPGLDLAAGEIEGLEEDPRFAGCKAEYPFFSSGSDCRG